MTFYALRSVRRKSFWYVVKCLLFSKPLLFKMVDFFRAHATNLKWGGGGEGRHAKRSRYTIVNRNTSIDYGYTNAWQFWLCINVPKPFRNREPK